MSTFEMTFQESKNDFKVGFNESQPDFKVGFRDLQIVETGVTAEPYSGPYDVTPRVVRQELLTNGKIMLDDVEVKSIPYHEVSNNSDGVTVSIACEFHEPIKPEEVVLIVPKTITKNGTYYASADGVHGYNPVVVDVQPEGIEGSLEISHSDGTIEQHEFIELNTEEK